MASTLVIVPTYEEIESLPDVLGRTLLATPDEVDILVVDDASPDGTGVIADRIAANGPRVAVLHRATRSGLGSAVLAGVAWAIDRGYDVVVTMAADGEHCPEDIPRMLATLETCDFVQGSRWAPGGRVEGWPLRRRLTRRAAGRMVGSILRLGVADPIGGFRAARTVALRTLPLEVIAAGGYSFPIDLLRHAVAAGLSVSEVPITTAERQYGRSKTGPATWWAAARDVVRWRRSRRRR